MIRTRRHLGLLPAVRRVHAHAITFLALLALCSPHLDQNLQAQETREETIAAQTASKAEHLEPYVPSRAERIFSRVEQRYLEQPNGFFPMFGSAYPGGSFTLGVGSRRAFGDEGTINLFGLFSVKSYKRVELSVISRGHARGRGIYSANLGWRDATQVGYYGLGITTEEESRANYRMKQTYASGAAEFKSRRWLVVGGAVGFDDYGLESGRGSFPSIEQVYTPESAPGLGTSPTFVHVSGTARLDWRTSPGYSRKGGVVGATVRRYADFDDVSSFSDAELNVVEHIPILKETWVVSLRGDLRSVVGDGIPPYFLLPSIGGGSSLRGYSSFRFADRNALAMSAEWRWIPNRMALDLALFCDMGTVAPEAARLDFTSLKTDCGIGARFHSPISTPLRIELAKGEGWHLVFSGVAAF